MVPQHVGVAGEHSKLVGQLRVRLGGLRLHTLHHHLRGRASRRCWSRRVWPAAHELAGTGQQHQQMWMHRIWQLTWAEAGRDRWKRTCTHQLGQHELVWACCACVWVRVLQVCKVRGQGAGRAEGGVALIVGDLCVQGRCRRACQCVFGAWIWELY